MTSPFGVAVAAAMLLFAPLASAGQDHPGQYDRSDIEAGARLYAAQCSGCHGVTGDQVTGVDLRRNQFKTVISDEDLTRVLASGRPDAGMPAFATFQAREVTGVIAFIRAGFDAGGAAVKVGEPGRGRTLFSGKGGCVTCHRVGTEGARTAPDLSDIGVVRSAAALQRILLEPATNVMPANRTVRVVTREGKTLRGRRLNEDTYTIQIIDDQERLVSFVKSELRSLEILPVSMMQPASATLAPGEIGDVIAYLLSLKGTP